MIAEEGEFGEILLYLMNEQSSSVFTQKDELSTKMVIADIEVKNTTACSITIFS